MSSNELRKELFEVTNANGYIFCEKHDIPEELLPTILSYVEPKDLVFGCRIVCKTWCNVIDFQVWKIKCRRNNHAAEIPKDLPWFAYYWIITKNILNRNLIKNGCGQENLKHWDILANGGQKWKVEKPPIGCQDFPENAEKEILANNSCFVTSSNDCVKEQIIDLSADGVTAEFMDIIKPKVIVSEWIAGRRDCTSLYRLSVTLLDANKTPMQSPLLIKKKFQWVGEVGSENGSSWRKIIHVFDDYDPGVRFIKFQHFGRDLPVWEGHFGSKMTGASVILSIANN